MDVSGLSGSKIIEAANKDNHSYVDLSDTGTGFREFTKKTWEDLQPGIENEFRDIKDEEERKDLLQLAAGLSVLMDDSWENMEDYEDEDEDYEDEDDDRDLDEERAMNNGFTNDEMQELMCQGIKPWDDDARAALDFLYNF